MTLVIDAFQHPRQPVAILTIIAAGCEDMPTRGMEALAQAIIALQAEVGLVALGAFPFAPGPDADAEILEQRLGDRARCHHATPLSRLIWSMRCEASTRFAGDAPLSPRARR